MNKHLLCEPISQNEVVGKVKVFGMETLTNFPLLI